MNQTEESILNPEISERNILMIDVLKRGKDVDPARLSALTPENWKKFKAIAAHQRVTPLVFYRLKKKNLDQAVPSDVYASLKEVYQQNIIRIMKISGQSRRVLKALNTAGIPTIPLKGIVLANSVYESIGLRKMSDIDLLVPSEKLARAVEILTGMGYKTLEPFSLDSIIQFRMHLPPFVKKDHVTIEIHWNITSPNTYYSIDPQELWEQAVPGQILDYETLILSPEDFLLHICLHTSYQHQFDFGLGPFCDIAEVIHHFGTTLDWQVAMEKAHQRVWSRGVYMALVIAAEFAGADVPRDVLERLRPADVTDSVLNNVAAQILTEKYSTARVFEIYSNILAQNSFIDQIKIIIKRVFMPRKTIASQNLVPVDSFRVYLYYPLRFIDVLLRHGRTFLFVAKQKDIDPSLKILIERKNLISKWLSGA
ncbi:MAG TPA: nucleotidyltransferase family protein [Smithella sp.]|nr:nucleotidyltransferase family protein [Smithella sp.]